MPLCDLCKSLRAVALFSSNPFRTRLYDALYAHFIQRGIPEAITREPLDGDVRASYNGNKMTGNKVRMSRCAL